jgi:spermidine/putrescine transport system permease protein
MQENFKWMRPSMNLLWGLPLTLWGLLFVVAPMALLLGYSFCGRDALGQVVWSFTWENYQRVFDPVYLSVFFRSFLFASVTTGVCLLMGYPAAYFIARLPEERRNLYLFLVMIPFWTSFLIRTYAWITILKSEGILNAVLGTLPFVSTSLDLLYTPAAVLIGLIYTFLPFMILPIYSCAEKLDPSLVEAGSDLGANPFWNFIRVILPLTRPGIWAGILFVFVPTFGMFAVVDLLGGSQTPLIGNVIQNQFLQARNWPFGSALGVILLAMFFVLYAIAQKEESDEHGH